MVELNEGLSTLFNTINFNLRHADYQRVQDVAQDFITYATGVGVEKKLLQFNARESADAFKQRVKLTKVNTPDIFHSCIKPMAKVGRTPSTIRTEWDGKDKSKANELRKQLFAAGENFWGDKNVTQYVAQRMVDLDSTDPNSFIVVEFDGVVDPTDPESKAKPYPFEVNSAEAVNYIYKNNTLQWLIALNAISIVDKDEKSHPGEKYYMYIDEYAITATEIHKDSVPQFVGEHIAQVEPGKVYQPLTDYLFETTKKGQKTERYFIIRIFEHKIGFVPARRVGTILDPTTRNRTCVPLVFAAQSYFEKSIKSMSEFDLTNCLHVFPQKISYSDPCPGEIQDGITIGCQSGYRPDGKTLCGACKGSGFKEHTSAQDILRIRMPRDLKEIVSLENVLVYKHPPIDLLEFQKQFGFVELRQWAQAAVYNSDVFSRQEVAKTATEKSIDLDAVYDTLAPFAESWSAMFVHIYKCLEALRDLGMEDGKRSNFYITHEFPKDFKMQSLSALLDDLQKASQNGAPSHIKKAITKDITRKIYADSPHEALKVEVKEKYFPFSGKSESEINFILANGLTTKFLKTFYCHFDLVFSEIEQETKALELDFYEMDEKMQIDLIRKKVDEYVAEIEAEDAQAAATSFNNNPNDPTATQKP